MWELKLSLFLGSLDGINDKKYDRTSPLIVSQRRRTVALESIKGCRSVKPFQTMSIGVPRDETPDAAWMADCLSFVQLAQISYTAN